MPAPSLAFDHVALPMFDAGATRAFYRDVLGFELVDALAGDDWGGRAWLMMIFADAGGRQLALTAFDGARGSLDGDWPADARHYAFAAPDAKALAAWKAKLDAAGVAWREEDHGGQASIYFDDPNGTVIEIAAPPTPAARADAEADAVVDAWIAR